MDMAEWYAKKRIGRYAEECNKCDGAAPELWCDYHHGMFEGFLLKLDSAYVTLENN